MVTDVVVQMIACLREYHPKEPHQIWNHKYPCLVHTPYPDNSSTTDKGNLERLCVLSTLLHPQIQVTVRIVIKIGAGVLTFLQLLHCFYLSTGDVDSGDENDSGDSSPQDNETLPQRPVLRLRPPPFPLRGYQGPAKHETKL